MTSYARSKLARGLESHVFHFINVFPYAEQHVFTDDEATKAVAGWKSAVQASSQGKMDAQALTEAGSRYLTFLDSNPATPLQIQLRQQGSDAHVYLALAEAWLAQGDNEAAMECLAAESGRASGELLQSIAARNSDAFIERVLRAHSALLAPIKDIHPFQGIGYQGFRVPAADGISRFVFIYRVDGTEEAQVELENLASNDERLMIRLSEQSAPKSYSLGDRAEIVGTRGKVAVAARASAEGLSLDIKGVTKVVEYSASGIPRVHPSPKSKLELKIVGGKIEQTMAAISRMAADSSNQPSPPANQ